MTDKTPAGEVLCPVALTPTGESIKPILTAMYRWGDAYLAKRNRKSCCSMKPPADE